MQFAVGRRRQRSFFIVLAFSMATASSSLFGINWKFWKSSPKPSPAMTESVENSKVHYIRIVAGANGNNEVSCTTNKSDISAEDAFVRVVYDTAEESICVVNDEVQQKPQITASNEPPVGFVTKVNKIVDNIAKVTDMGANFDGKKVLADFQEAVMSPEEFSGVLTDFIDKVKKFANDPETIKKAKEQLDFAINKLDNLTKERRKELKKDLDAALIQVRHDLDTTGKKVIDDLMMEINKKFAPGGPFHQIIDSIRALAVKKVFKDVVIYATLAALGIATSFHMSRVFWNYVERQLYKPRLFIEYYQHGQSSKPLPKIPQMVLPPHLQQWFDDYTAELIATREARDRGEDVKFRTLVMFGKPGTGKTMKAKQIAYQSRFNFAFMTGSSLFQDGAGIEAIDEVFAHLEKSDTPTILFIDEADSLFVDRTTMDPTSLNYKMVNHLLNYLGTRSSKYVIFLTTNHLRRFDVAMQRRIDEVVEMPLPDRERRIDALKLYINMFLGKVENVNEIFTETQLAKMALLTAGFCYGDFEGIINKIKSKVLVTKQLTTELVDSVVEEFCDKQVAFALAE
ncbi:MAG TPA: ATP-binding protein [Candidatus Babeliales bacterium]|nr:ATP-binding protein [Candidatus Babeliales bacterium]